MTVPRRRDAGVERARPSLLRLEQVAQADGEVARVALDDRARVVGRVVVDDDDVPAPRRARRACARSDAERRVEQRGAVVGRDEDGGVGAVGS